MASSEDNTSLPEEPKSEGASPNHHKSFWEKLRAYFLTGILFIAPLGLTVWLTWIFVKAVDGWLQPVLPEGYKIPGLGFVVFLIGITLIGALARGIVGRYFIHTSENVLRRMPIIRNIYIAIKQVAETISASQSKAFRHVVMFEYPRPGIWVIGFETGHPAHEILEKVRSDFVNIFLPTTPNPTSGFLLFLPREDIIYLNMSVEDGLKIVISGGIITQKDEYTNFSRRRKDLPMPPANKGV